MPITTPFISDRVNAKLRNVAERFMVWSCTIKRGANPAPRSGYNQPGKPTAWAAHLTAQKCSLGQQSTTVLTGENQDKNRAMIVGRYKLEFPYGTDVLITDRVYDLKDRDGNLVDPTVKFYEIKELIPDDTSLSLSVEAIH
jgi:hypothetical protein